MNIEKVLGIFEKYALYIVAILFPVFILPFFPSPFILPKEIFLFVIISLVLLSWSFRMFKKGEAVFHLGKFDLGVFLLAISYIVSTIFRTPNKMEAFLFPGTVTFVVLSCLFYFVVNQYDKKVKAGVLTSLFISGILLSISVIFTQLGMFSKIPQLPAFLKDTNFNPLGGVLPSAIYLLTVIPFGIVSVVKEKDIVKKLFYAVASTVIVAGVAMMISTMLPGKSQTPTFPNLQVSWEVLIETIKKSPLFGIGPGNYLTAFNLFRPVTYNQSALWAIRFSTAGNFYFTFITEAGLIGLAALGVLLLSIYKAGVKAVKEKAWEALTVLVMLVLFLVFPAVPAIFFLLFALLSVFSLSEGNSLTLSTTKVPTVIVIAPILIGIGLISFFGGKAVAAEITYKKSLDALSKNDAKLTYDLMTKAVQENPRVDRYHASLAQIDMALATAIATNKDISDTDRQTITQLVQQAINEGKATATLNPGRSGNWEVLAQIYRSIMSFAQGADQFAVQSYTQAVALDPTNPNLRIALGGTYYALGRYDEAIDSFKLAVLSKSDLPNAHYNLAIAYREKKNYADAIKAMNNVLSLLKSDSADYELAKSTLADLEKKVSGDKTAQGEDLTTPEPITKTIDPPIKLPEEATPPAVQQ